MIGQSIWLDAATGCLGLLLGLAYFAALRRTIALFSVGRGWQTVLLLSLARVSLAVAAFFLVAQLGATPLISAAAGFLIARMICLRLAREPR